MTLDRALRMISDYDKGLTMYSSRAYVDVLKELADEVQMLRSQVDLLRDQSNNRDA